MISGCVKKVAVAELVVAPYWFIVKSNIVMSDQFNQFAVVKAFNLSHYYSLGLISGDLTSAMILNP